MPVYVVGDLWDLSKIRNKLSQLPKYGYKTKRKYILFN